MTNEFNIDIDKLSGMWKTMAEQADNHTGEKGNDGKINSAFEAIALRNLALENGQSEDNINKIFGGDFNVQPAENTDEQKPSSEQEATTSSVNNGEPTDAEKKALENAALGDISQAFSSIVLMAGGGISWEDMVSIVNDKYNAQDADKSINKNYALALIEPMKDVAQKMSAKTFNSREDILAIYKEVKEELKSKSDDPYQKFKLDVLKQFISVAEAYQQNEELKKVSQRYDELRKSGKSREEAMADIKNDEKFSGSYYHPRKKKQGVIHQFERSNVMQEARDEVWDAYNNQKNNEELNTYRKVKSAAKKELKTQDKYTNKVLRGERTAKEKFSMEQSVTKTFGTSIALGNRVKANTEKGYTFEELSEVFKKDENIQRLLEKGWITKSQNENGEATYNIMPLAEKIKNNLGADVVANKQNKEYRAYSEVAHVIEDLASQAGVQLKEKEVKKLIEFCGFKVEGKNWVKIGLKSLADTVIPGAGMIGGVLLSSKKANHSTIHNVSIDYTSTVDLKFLLEQNINVNLNLVLPDGVTINGRDLYNDLLAQGISADNIHLTYDKSGKLVGASFGMADISELEGKTLNVKGTAKDDIPCDVQVDKKLWKVLLKQIGLSYALSFVQNAFQEKGGERPIIPTQFDTTDFNQYKKDISVLNLTDAQKLTLTNLAELYTIKDEKGNVTSWDAEGYKLLLNKIGGNRSFLSKNELAIGAYNALHDDELKAKIAQSLPSPQSEPEKQPPAISEPVATTTVVEPEVTVPPVGGPEGSVQLTTREDFDESTIEANYHKANKHTWKGIAALYADCLKANPHATEMDIIHAIKDINGIKYTDNVIPKDLYLPEYLLPENSGTLKTFASEQEREAYVFKHDMQIKKENWGKVVKSNGTKIETRRTSKGFIGIKTWRNTNGEVIATNQTQEYYKTAKEAEEAASKLDKPKK